MRAYKRIRSDNVDVNRLQESVVDQFDAFKTCPLLDGVLVPITLATGSNVFSHKLGRLPQGWFFTDRNAATTVYRTAWTADSITFTASASLTGTIWVF